jgi:RNA polymerase sigma-70 factor (ECF subfamily)
MVVEETAVWPGHGALIERRAMDADAPLSSIDLATLTQRMAGGDEAAWRAFCDHYFHRLLRYLLVLAGGREEAAREALQLTLVRVVRHIRRFDSEEVFWSWLTVLARSSLVDEERKRKRYFGLLDRFFAGADRDDLAPSRDADGSLLALLERNLAGLEPEERGLLERKYFDGLAVKDIAREQQTTEKTIDSRLVRLRRKLKDAILTQLNNET